MDKNQSLILAAIIFAAVALLHLLRSIFGWDLVLNDFNIPLYISYAVVVIAGYLSWHMYSASKK